MSRYEPLSIIEYQGTLSPGGDTNGHYICDVKDAKTNKWFRTNDNCDPIQIEVCNVSKNGYAILFKRCSQ